jgi:hypothetical protein
MSVAALTIAFGTKLGNPSSNERKRGRLCFAE